MTGPATTGQPADVGIRLGARLIDYVILGIVLTLINILVIGAIWNTSGGNGFVMSYGNSYAATAVSAVVSALVYLGYFSLMESGQGKTLGKMILRLQTRGPNGGKPTAEQAVRRNIWVAAGILAVVPVVGSWVGGLLELVAVIAIIVTISQSPTKQGWHDQFAGGTSVVRS
jgi:uncharacterized RDD family membrane protein YckC